MRTLLNGGEEADTAVALAREFDIDHAQALQDARTLVRQPRSSGLAS
ncbi:hypothetical protein [Streptomyces sp. NPDC092370]